MKNSPDEEKCGQVLKNTKKRKNNFGNIFANFGIFELAPQVKFAFKEIRWS